MLCGDTDHDRYIQQEPVAMLVSPQRKKYFVHKALLAAKSPYFAANLKDCWDGLKDEVELLDTTEAAFEIVMDWMYLEKLPTRVTEYVGETYDWQLTPLAYKLADRLMIPELQNTLLQNEADILLKNNRCWSLIKVSGLAKIDMCHTPYYTWCLKVAIYSMMKETEEDNKKFEIQARNLEEHPTVAIDVIICINNWNVKPWEDPRGDGLSEFMVPEN